MGTPRHSRPRDLRLPQASAERQPRRRDWCRREAVAPVSRAKVLGHERPALWVPRASRGVTPTSPQRAVTRAVGRVEQATSAAGRARGEKHVAAERHGLTRAFVLARISHANGGRVAAEDVGDGSVPERGGAHGLDGRRHGEEPLPRAQDDGLDRRGGTRRSSRSGPASGRTAHPLGEQVQAVPRHSTRCCKAARGRI